MDLGVRAGHRGMCPGRGLLTSQSLLKIRKRAWPSYMHGLSCFKDQVGWSLPLARWSANTGRAPMLFQDLSDKLVLIPLYRQSFLSGGTRQAQAGYQKSLEGDKYAESLPALLRGSFPRRLGCWFQEYKTPAGARSRAMEAEGKGASEGSYLRKRDGGVRDVVSQTTDF